MLTTPAAQAQSNPALIEIERLGFRWTEVAQYDLERLSAERRIQVRDSRHYAPKDEVERYAVQMAEVEFPPIIVTGDDEAWLVDGNTRVGASLMRGQKFFPAYVLDVDYKGSSAKNRDLLHALAATLNAKNGRALDRKETRAVAERLILLGWKADQIGRAIGIRAAGVTAVKREIDAAGRLKRVGINANGDLRGASLRALGSGPALSLNDQPYRELASLAADAGLNAGEIISFAKETKSKGSEGEQVDTLTTLRTEMGERIRDLKLTGVSKPPPARQLRQHLGFVTKHAGDEGTLVETNREVVDQHVEAITESIAVLQAVLIAQQAR
jgi:hypothetical protein